MRNTYNISLLRRRIQDSLPRPPAPAGERAIEGFLSLPGASVWRPDRLGLRELSFIFDVGLPFALIGDKPIARTLGLHVGEAIRDRRAPEARLWSAVHAVALLCHWGLEVRVTNEVVAARLQFEVVPPGGAPLSLDVRRALQEPTNARVVALDMQSADFPGQGVSFDTAAAYYGNLFRDGLAAVLLFEPRFWIGIEQKEWLHMARLSENADGLEPQMFGIADSDRFAGAQALRVPLLT